MIGERRGRGGKDEAHTHTHTDTAHGELSTRCTHAHTDLVLRVDGVHPLPPKVVGEEVRKRAIGRRDISILTTVSGEKVGDLWTCVKAEEMGAC